MDTIAAIATANAAAAVGILRISGDDTLRVLGALFTPASGKELSSLPPRRMSYGAVHDARRRVIDHALAVWFSAEKSTATAPLSCWMKRCAPPLPQERGRHVRASLRSARF